MKVIFYKARNGNFVDKAIAWYTSSWRDRLNGNWLNGYSHCELLFKDGMMFSASEYDNAVRFTHHKFDADKWDYKEVTVSELHCKAYAMQRNGEKYDYKGIVGFIIPFVKDDNDKSFCSEVCYDILVKSGMEHTKDSSKVSPNLLSRIINKIYNLTNR